jgi:hypothetical protein
MIRLLRVRRVFHAYSLLNLTFINELWLEAFRSFPRTNPSIINAATKRSGPFITLEHEKTNRFLSDQRTSMEEKALETLRTMLGRRGLETKTERVIVHGHEADRANLYTIGNVLVVFSQKDNGLMVRDINGFLAFASQQ